MTTNTPFAAAATDVDVLIVGAGISGIGAACHLATKRPGTTFAILEGREAIGGTWDLFRYPGIRSDSDLHTFGYAFKPWTHENAIAKADLILDYLRETVVENGVDEHIRFGHRVLSAQFCSAAGHWTVTAEQADSGEQVELTARFVFSGAGYYDYEAGYTPEFEGVESFRGQVVHPQHWPEDLDYTGKRVVVIGSGATAATLIPAMATTAGHVTMLQRSPSYVLSLPAKDAIANALNRVLGSKRGYAITRRKNILLQRAIYKTARRFPRAVRRLLMADARRRLPNDFDVDTHFNPSYDPWDQRLCTVPDGDLFKAISSGAAGIVTDRIECFTPRGLRLLSGRELEADIVVTATGLNMKPMGGIDLVVDGDTVELPETTVYKGMMLSDVPNFAFAIGYTDTAWTLKVDLICEHFCRLLDHMDARGHDTVVARCEDDSMERNPLFGLSSGYIQRAVDRFPKAGTSGPWEPAVYEHDVARLRHGAVEDPALRFATNEPRPTRLPEPADHDLLERIAA